MKFWVSPKYYRKSVILFKGARMVLEPGWSRCQGLLSHRATQRLCGSFLQFRRSVGLTWSSKIQAASSLSEAKHQFHILELMNAMGIKSLPGWKNWNKTRWMSSS